MRVPVLLHRDSVAILLGHSTQEAEGKFSKVSFLQGSGKMVEVGVVGRAPEESFSFVLLTGKGPEESQLLV